LQKYRQEMAEQQRELEALKAETLALIEREGESRRQLGEMERVMRERWAARAGSAAALQGYSVIEAAGDREAPGPPRGER